MKEVTTVVDIEYFKGFRNEIFGTESDYSIRSRWDDLTENEKDLFTSYFVNVNTNEVIMKEISLGIKFSNHMIEMLRGTAEVNLEVYRDSILEERGKTTHLV